MANIILVHGSWHGGWCWDRVRPRLEAAGHVVYAPTLTGLAERAGEATPEVDVGAHVADIEALLLGHDLSDVTLVGWSYGGMVITALAERVPDRLAGLLYLDAVIPEDGQTGFDLLPPDVRRVRQQQVLDDGEGWWMAPPPLAALGVTSPADVAWVGDRLTPQPLGTYTSPVSVSNPAARRLPRTYVQCLNGAFVPVTEPFARRAEQRGSTVRRLPCGHAAPIVAAEQVAGLVLEALPSDGGARRGRRF